jgi:hypothetical protein
MKKPIREFDEENFPIWFPVKDCSIGPFDLGLEEKRRQALLMVMCRIPDEDYEKVGRLNLEQNFDWFIPNWECLGRVEPFYTDDQGDKKFFPCAKVLYLNPRLEKLPRKIAVAVIAHEIAHLVLNHEFKTVDYETEQAQEKSAWKLVVSWGFEEEVKKWKAFRKRIAN